MKLRARSTSDGRIGWPSVLEYELTEGPDKGKRIPVPPRFESHPHPDPQELKDQGCAFNKASCAYREVIHDPEGYRSLKDAGHLNDPMHRGESRRFDGMPTS